ncbi:MAG: DNA mismatch repair protein MutS [Flavobacteriales bacterium]|nr:DNA mismatch repair protein MutS [Flavobacteriales bacterium]
MAGSKTASKKPAETPLMKQYNKIKSQYPDALLLFRVGDFYETFGEDAIKASQVLGIVLTKRKNGAAAYVELAGFPHHSLDTYLPKLVRAGNRVAICDQLEDPKTTKKIVKRGVTELVTPGVALNDKVLETKSNNFLAAVTFDKRAQQAGVSFLDISTGEFLVAEGSTVYIDKLMQSFKPSEVLYQRNTDDTFSNAFGDGFYTYKLEDWVFTEDYAQDLLLKHFQTSSLKGYGIEELSLGVIAAGAALHYLGETKHGDTDHIRSISRIAEDSYVWLDRFTIRNLELINSPHPDATTLFDVLDHTVSPMGSRMLKRWMVLPLRTKKDIESRLNTVAFWVANTEAAEAISREVKSIGDLERLISKAATGRINPREVLQLRDALQAIEPIREFCLDQEIEELRLLGDQLNLCSVIRDRITAEVLEEPPLLVNKGGVMADGINPELDELRSISANGKDHLMAIQQRESEITGIPSLKIAYNNVFGYYLEVRNAHKDKVPETWIRKQTLTQAERYITEELKELEAKILGAEEKISDIEQKLFAELVQAISEYIAPIQLNAQLIARLDSLISFAKVAIRNGYVRPSLHEDHVLNIKDGRHPVIEQNLPLGESYVTNDVYLDNEQQQIIMITGPNMSGKSALLRQTALITLMAQMGSFVPAKSADIGLVDKIFTRVGASDNISSGESTFMVEMNETASILNNLTDRSLVLLDEIGRGTSTYDGISIAWAIAEYLHQNPKARAKTLFATHYHELNEMAGTFERIHNYNVSVKEHNGKIIFLRKLVKGGSNHSFGIHVAKLAGMPVAVIERASKVLKQLEKSHAGELSGKAKEIAADNDMQLSFFQLDDPVLERVKEEILATDINTLTPVEALMKLNEIKKAVGG